MFQREGLFLSTAELHAKKQCNFIKQQSTVQGRMNTDSCHTSLNGIYCVAQLHGLNSVARAFTQIRKAKPDNIQSQIPGRTVPGARIH